MSCRVHSPDPTQGSKKIGFLIVLGLVFVLPMIGRELGVDLNLFRWLVGTPLAHILPTFKSVAGL